MKKFYGFKRPDGRIGTRNLVAVIALTETARVAAEAITKNVKGVISVSFPYGRAVSDAESVIKTITGYGAHPNIYGSIIIDMPGNQAEKISKIISETGKPVKPLAVMGAGTINTIMKGTIEAQKLAIEASEIRRVKTSLDHIILAVECGGSDATSGISSNPVTGYVSDKVIDTGGTVIFNEPSELQGIETILANRAVNEIVKKKVLGVIKRQQGMQALAPPPVRDWRTYGDNVRGGLTTIEEKSYGSALKAGHRPVKGVLNWCERPRGNGLFLMDAPSSGEESVTSMVAAGANIVVFSTGQGNPMGNPFAPVIKCSGNKNTVTTMSEHIDVDVSNVTYGMEEIRDAGERLWEELLKTISGKLTKAETLSHNEWVIPRINDWKLYPDIPAMKKK
jgi:altronate dehydratase